MRTLNIAFILDPLDALKPYKDSSIAMMREAARRGHRVWSLMRPALHWTQAGVQADATPLTLHEGDAPWYSPGTPERRTLKSFDAVLMRQDPPFASHMKCFPRDFAAEFSVTF